ncbi:unnamed protein product [Ectocarpus fasciculatus]
MRAAARKNWGGERGRGAQTSGAFYTVCKVHAKVVRGTLDSMFVWCGLLWLTMPTTQPQSMLERLILHPLGPRRFAVCMGRALVGVADMQINVDQSITEQVSTCACGGRVKSIRYQLKARGASLCLCVRVRKG